MKKGASPAARCDPMNQLRCLQSTREGKQLSGGSSSAHPKSNQTKGNTVAIAPERRKRGICSTVSLQISEVHSHFTQRAPPH